jgi:ACS family glucarate transporter-like MFS transporter
LTISHPTSRPTRIRWLIFWLACLTSFLNYVHRYSWGVAKPYLQDEYQLSDGEVGWLDAAFNLTYALGQFPGGLAGDLFGPRMVIPAAALLWSLVVAAPGLVTGFWQLYVVRLLFGAAQAPAYPNLGKITKSWFPLSIRTSVQGMVASFSGRAGAACASLIVATLLIDQFGLSWQTALWVIAVAGVFFAVGFWLLFRNTPKEHPWTSRSEQELIQVGEEPVSKQTSSRFHWSKANRYNLAFFLAASFCSTFADNLFVFWMPKFLVDEKGFGPFEMGIFASLPLWGGALGGLCGGFVNDFLIRATGNRRLARSLVASVGKSLAAVLIVASLAAQDGRVVMVVLFCCKFFSDWSQPTWWGTVTDIGGPAAGRVFGMVNMFGSIGAFIAGPTMGYVKQYLGFEALFCFVGGVYVLTAIWWVFVDCTRKLVVTTTHNADEPDNTDEPVVP